MTAKRIAIVGYREWAKELFNKVNLGGNMFSSSAATIEWCDTLPNDYEYDLAFFVGWSEMVPEYFYANVPSFVLHPSPLPRYRGGSPIQHQIINGETQSAVTIFKLDPKYPAIDSGPITWQMGYSLEGSLKDILSRIVHVGSRGVVNIIETYLSGNVIISWAQHQDGYDVYKRRKPEESEIMPDAFQQNTALAIHNKVRALQDPYPLPYVVCADGRKLYIRETALEDK